MDMLAGGSSAKSFGNKIQFNTDRDAFNYLLGQQKLPRGAANAVNPDATITEGYLRSEVDLTQQNQITFPITVDDGNAPRNATERRLAISQMFLVTQVSVMLYTAGAEPTPEDRAQAVLHTYPAIEVNAGTADMNVIYNGFLQARVDQVTYFDALDTKRFFRAGTAQQGVEVSTGATNPAYVADEWDSQNWGMYRLTPFIFLGGQSNNVITLNLPANIDLTDNNATCVLFLRGLLIQNAYKNTK